MPAPRELLPQLTLQGHVKDNAAGGETISFSIPLGPVTLICIANIPQDNDATAPVYVKFKTDTRQTQQYINNRIANMGKRDGSSTVTTNDDNF